MIQESVVKSDGYLNHSPWTDSLAISLSKDAFGMTRWDMVSSHTFHSFSHGLPFPSPAAPEWDHEDLDHRHADLPPS